jgi:hypothetical protein
MVQPKYSPKEALNKIKLMMSYDSSKTLTENVGIVKNKVQINEAAPVILAALVAAGFSLPSWTNSSTKQKLNTLTQGCDKTDNKSVALKRETLSSVDQAKLASQFKKSFDWTVFGLGIGGGTELTILRKALSDLETKGNYGDFCKVRELMGGSEFDQEIISELNNQEIGEVISVIQLLLTKSAKGNIKTRDAETANVNWWIESYPCLEVTDSFADPISVETDRYGNSFVSVNFKIKGQVKAFHLLNNGRIYTADTHKYTGKRVVCSGTRVSVIAESLKKKSIYEQADLGNINLSDNGTTDLEQNKPNPNPNPIKPPKTNRYRDCGQGPFKKGCRTTPEGYVGQVQGCLGGLVQDGKFWEKTEARLMEKTGRTEFTISDIAKICEKTNEVPEISGEAPPDVDGSNSDF